MNLNSDQYDTVVSKQNHVSLFAARVRYSIKLTAMFGGASTLITTLNKNNFFSLLPYDSHGRGSANIEL